MQLANKVLSQLCNYLSSHFNQYRCKYSQIKADSFPSHIATFSTILIQLDLLGFYRTQTTSCVLLTVQLTTKRSRFDIEAFKSGSENIIPDQFHT